MQKNMFFVVVLALRFIIKLRFPNDVPIMGNGINLQVTSLSFVFSRSLHHKVPIPRRHVTQRWETFIDGNGEFPGTLANINHMIKLRIKSLLVLRTSGNHPASRKSANDMAASNPLRQNRSFKLKFVVPSQKLKWMLKYCSYLKYSFDKSVAEISVQSCLHVLVANILFGAEATILSFKSD